MFGFLAKSRNTWCAFFNSSGSETARTARGGVEKNFNPAKSVIKDPLTFINMLSVILSIVSLTPGGITKLPLSPQIGGKEFDRGLVSNKLKLARPATLFFKSASSWSICAWHSSSVRPPCLSAAHLESTSNTASHKLLIKAGDSTTLQISRSRPSPIPSKAILISYIVSMPAS